MTSPGAFDIAVRGLNALLMVVLGLGLGVLLSRRARMPWGLYGIGAATFVLSQVAHIPFNNWALNPLFTRLGWTDLTQAGALIGVSVALGLSAGLFEEIARYLTFRFWARRARRWEEALMLGAGHGGIEAVLLGLLTLYGLIQALALQGTDLASVVPADQVETARAQIEAFWGAPWYAALLGALERAFALCLHLSLSVLVLQAVSRRKPVWLALAIAWHALVDAAAVAAMSSWGPYWTEVLVAVFAAASLAIVFALRPRRQEAGTDDDRLSPGAPTWTGQDEPPSHERLDDSRFAGGEG